MDTNIILDASFRGIPFDCQTTSDPVKRAIVVHEYAYKDGGEVDDMGRDARVFSINAIFFGDTYQQEMQAFIAALDEGGAGELIHPIYGTHMVVVREYTPDHDADNPDSCKIAITFVESGLHTPFFNLPETAKGNAQNAADGATSAMDAANEAYAASFEEWVKAFLQENPATNTLATVAEVFRNGAHLLDDIIDAADTVISFLDFPRAFVGELESVYSRVKKVANLGDGVTERFTGWQRLSDFCKGVSAGGSKNKKTYGTKPEPASITPPTLQEMEEDAALADGITSAGSAQAPTSDNPLTEDAQTDNAEGEATALVGVGHAVAQAREVTDTVCDLLLDEADAPILNPAEVETIVNNARERIQDAMAMVRISLPPHRIRPITESLRDAAEQVQDLGAAVINARPPLITHTIAADCNVHFLAHLLYGDYTRATEVLRLNPGIMNPNFLQRGQRVTIYAE